MRRLCHVHDHSMHSAIEWHNYCSPEALQTYILICACSDSRPTLHDLLPRFPHINYTYMYYDINLLPLPLHIHTHKSITHKQSTVPNRECVCAYCYLLFFNHTNVHSHSLTLYTPPPTSHTPQCIPHWWLHEDSSGHRSSMHDHNHHQLTSLQQPAVKYSTSNVEWSPGQLDCDYSCHGRFIHLHTHPICTASLFSANVSAQRLQESLGPLHSYSAELK